MKKLASIPAVLIALPTVAHDAGPVAHAHPHGVETAAAAFLGLCIAAFVVWRR